MDKENIKKIISETLSSEEFMNGIIEQIQSQIKKEQEKVNDSIAKINEEINVNKKAINKNQENPKSNQKASPKPNLKPLYFMPKVTTIDDENICDIYTKFPEKISDINYLDMGDNIKRLYSLLSANMNNWDNWFLDATFNKDIPNTGISERLDVYFYNFTDTENILIKNNKDSIKSYIYIDLDDFIKTMTIYVINYSDVTHKVYDFYRCTFYPNTDASDEAMILFYYNLYNYFSNVDNIQEILDEYMNQLVNEYIIVYKDETMHSTEDNIAKNLKNVIQSIILDYKLLCFQAIDKWSNIDKVDNMLTNKEDTKEDKSDENELDILKEYSKTCSEGFKISSSDDNLQIEINASKDKRDKIKLLVHLAMDGFIKVNYNQGDILFYIDGEIISMDNPYWI